MPTLDFPREFDPADPVILVPSFHTGALGFIPGTEVTVRNGARPPRFATEGRWRHYELVATPFESNHGRMFRMECNLVDEPGVVYRLLDAIAEMGINVVKEDSCTIDGGPSSGALHHVDLVLDWTDVGSLIDPVPSFPADRACYRELSNRIPIRDARYVRLFELIMIHCGDIIAFDNAYRLRHALPSIRIQPFSYRSNGWNIITKTLESCGRHMVVIPLSELEVRRIAHATDHEPHEPIKYLLSSDGESRTLRVQFLHKESARRIEHVAFRHTDQPGVISALGASLKSAKYNIVTSILRKELRDQSVWELVLEYEGKLAPDGQVGQSRTEAMQLVAARIHSATVPQQVKAIISGARVHLTDPSYPKPAAPITPIPIFEDVAAAPLRLAKKSGDETRHRVPVLKAHQKALEEAIAEGDREAANRHNAPRAFRAEEARHFLELVAESYRSTRPRLFLSYSKHAKDLAKSFKGHAVIDGGFELDEYQDEDNEKASESALKKIRSCDFFVGIWLREGDQSSVSPWMHFELGAARALDKPWALALDQGLDAKLRQRIDPEILHKPFSSASFADEYLDDLVSRVIRKWKEHVDQVLRVD